MWWDTLADAALDTLKLFPFLVLLYILIELMEHNTRVGKPNRALTGKFAPLFGAAAGIVPMCGFSVMAAKLYEHRHVTVGTLVAVFVATSDEALIVLLLSDALPWDAKLWSVLALVGCKLVLGAGAGYFLDCVTARRRAALAPLPESHGHDHDHDHDHDHEHDHDHGHVGEDESAHEHGECECAELTVCEHKKSETLNLYLFSPLLHALQVAAFVFLVNLLFGTLFFLLGEERVFAVLQGAGYWAQPAVCALVGIIPNCASSVVLAEVYAVGGIGFGGLLAGLVVNAGLGYLALLRGHDRRRALFILLGVFAFAVAVGYAACAVALAL